MTDDLERLTVGFVGLGNMGWRMGANLVAAGFPLVVRDAESDRQERFVAEFGVAGGTSPGSFRSCTVVVTMLPDGAAVREALLSWEGGLAGQLASGSVVLDMSSSDPVGTRSLAKDLAPFGVSVIDGPVSGGITRAENGTLTIMVGSDNEMAVDRVGPVLEVLGKRVFRTGPLGSGHAMKALNNFLGAASYAASTEALVIGEAFGLAPDVMVEILNVSSGRSFNTEIVLKDDVLTGRYGTGFALGLLAKDVGIAAGMAKAIGVDAPACALINKRWSDALRGLGSTADHSEAHKFWWSVNLTTEGPRDPATGAAV